MRRMFRFPRQLNWTLPLVVVSSMLLLAGCGGGGGNAVEGEVSLDGQPVDGGKIVFLATEDNQGRKVAQADIKNGKYSIPASGGPGLGKHKVTINWPKKTGRQVDSPGDPGVKMDETKEAIPSWYNAQTSQMVEIKSSGNKFDYSI